VKLVGVPAGRCEREIHCKFRLLFAKWVALLMFFEAHVLYSSACVCECVESLIIIAERPTPSSPRACHVVINTTSVSPISGKCNTRKEGGTRGAGN